MGSSCRAQAGRSIAPRKTGGRDFVWLGRKLLAESGLAPSEMKAVGTSAIGPCMLPVDADGAPLMNAVLYGVDTRASREIEDLTASIGAETIFAHCGNALTSQSVGPKILWLKRNRPDIYARAHKFLNSTSFLVHRLTGRFVTDHYTAANASPLYRHRRAEHGATRSRRTSRNLIAAGDRLDHGDRRRRHRARRGANRPPAGDACHRRHDRRSGRGNQRRRSRRRRNDADVRLDDFHDPDRPGRGERSNGSGTRHGFLPISRPVWRGLRPAEP